MSDQALFAILTFFTLVAKGVLDEVRERRKSREARELKIALEANTEVTVQGQNLLVHKVDSAEKAITEQASAAVDKADIAAKTAEKVVQQQTLAQHKASEQGKVIIQKQEDIAQAQEKMMNGGEGGLSNLSRRVSALETDVSSLKSDVGEIKGQINVMTKGQVDFVKSMDHFAEVLERKLP